MMMIVIMMMIASYTNDDDSHHDDACIVHSSTIYDAANFVPDGRTDEQGDSRSRMYDAYILDPDTRGHDAYMYDA